MKVQNKYSLPVKKEDIKGIKKGEESNTHKGALRNSIDYRLSVGTPIYASASGKVVFVKDNSKVGGPAKKYWDKGNAIVIKHKNEELTRYEHLKYGGAEVKQGQQIKAGQLIGYSGNTGYSNAPHLHFQVFKITGPNPYKDFETLELDFNNDSKNKRGLEKIVVIFSILSLFLSLVFSLRITGNSIGLNNSVNLVPLIFFIFGLLGLIYYFYKIR